MLISWLALTAAAAPAGFYHPAEVAAQSARYAEASTAAQQSAGALQERSVAVARALWQYDLSLDLLGDRASAGDRAHQAELAKQFNREMAQAQAFTDVWIEDFDTQFLAAVDRALAKLDGETVVCASEIAAGRSMPGLPAATKPNPDCTGTNHNSAIASAIDSDAQLADELAEILSMPFPAITLAPEPRSPTAGAAVALHPHLFFFDVAKGELARIDKADTMARVDIEADIALGATATELEGHTKTAQAITAKTDAAYAALAAPVLAAVDKANVKRAKKSEPVVGWCAQPEVFGGCSVPADPAVRAELAADKRVRKALP